MWVLHLLLKLNFRLSVAGWYLCFLLKITSDPTVVQIVALIEMTQRNMRSACILHHGKSTLPLRKIFTMKE